MFKTFSTVEITTLEGRRILVFSQFTTLLHLLAQEMTRLGLPYLMLTGETAAGQYPVQAMEYLVRTARTAM